MACSVFMSLLRPFHASLHTKIFSKLLRVIAGRAWEPALSWYPVGRGLAIDFKTQKVLSKKARHQTYRRNHQDEENYEEHIRDDEAEHNRKRHPGNIDVFQCSRSYCPEDHQENAGPKEIQWMSFVPPPEQQAQGGKDRPPNNSNLPSSPRTGLR